MVAVVTALLDMLILESFPDAPPADLLAELPAYARRRIAELERAIKDATPPTLAGYAMETSPGYSTGDLIASLVGLLDGWRDALAAVEDEQRRPGPILPHPLPSGVRSPPFADGEVRFTCWACDAQLGPGEVCARCCGAEAIPGRCALPAGHGGEHEAPIVASPSDYDEPWEPDRPPGCDWCGGRGCQICCAPGYAGVERD